MTLFVCAFALVWGVIWAMFLQLTRMGRFLAMRRTWITVVIGVGVDLLLLGLMLPWGAWLLVWLVVGLSALPIVLRSLLNEFSETEELVNGLRRSSAE